TYGEGRMDGHREGLKDGKAEILLHLLQKRFGPLPEPVRVRVQEAGVEALTRWTDGIFEAGSLQEVFAASVSDR
ncbi:MAG: hypothetical protein HQL91_12840, partial [Magnetococcales bacterium]|nr:hypothetical protein [Magnetococcales bacterium]